MKKIYLFISVLILGVIMSTQAIAKLEYATFAGGCFWCMEAAFEKLPGVEKVISGYTGGHKVNPTYKEVSAQSTGHVEAIQVKYNTKIISYNDLLDFFWQQIDPTDPNGQFVDQGSSYISAIFYHNATQKNLAEKSKLALAKSGRFKKPIVTEILPATKFYTAEDYHQDYYKKNPIRYKFYRLNSGRDQFLKKAWSKKINNPHSKNLVELKKKLTPMQYKVTQQDGTEPPFKNAYWDNKREGIYVDIVSGEPLFSSTDKFKSGTGWPSFTKPLEPNNIIERLQKSWFGTKVEVRSKHGDSHLGDVFKDGPPPTGLRYCINSAALKFIPKEDLVKAGYRQYYYLFNK